MDSTDAAFDAIEIHLSTHVAVSIQVNCPLRRLAPTFGRIGPPYDAMVAPYTRVGAPSDAQVPTYDAYAAPYDAHAVTYDAHAPLYDARAPSYDEHAPLYDALVPVYDAHDVAYDESSATFEATDAPYDCMDASAAAPSATSARGVGHSAMLHVRTGGTMKHHRQRQADALRRVQDFLEANADAVKTLGDSPWGAAPLCVTRRVAPAATRTMRVEAAIGPG